MSVSRVLGLVFILNLLVFANVENKIVGDSDDVKLYQIYVDDNGDLLDPLTKNIIPEKAEDINESSYVNDIFLNIKKKEEDLNTTLQLTIFIHGGLNSFKNANERVRELKKDMLKDRKYPLFISWKSGGVSNYIDHLLFLRRGIKSKILGPISSPFVLLEDVLRAIARIPASTYYTLFSQNTILKRKPLFYTKEEKAADIALPILRNSGFNIEDNVSKTGFKLIKDWATIWNPIKLVTAPIVDALGKGAWNSMLRRTDLVLRKDISSNNENPTNLNTAVTKFFDKYVKDDNISNKNITLIGHSMGTIVANNIITKYQNINWSNIVYMAPACKIKDIENVVVPYLNKNSHSKFYNLSLDPYRDISENTYYDFAPRGSLLVWIDQTLADINSFQDRTAGFWFNIIRSASETFKSLDFKDRVTLTRFGVVGKGPKKHGDFDAFNFWQEGFWKGKKIIERAEDE